MQDVFPEIAVKLGRLKSPAAARLLRLLIDPSLRAADRVVVIGETMKLRVEAKGVSPERVRVIPNWGDAASVVPMAHDNEWARRHKLAKRFVVMHSGNIGHAQNLDALVRAATFLRDLDDLAVVIIGGGARRSELVALAPAARGGQGRDPAVPGPHDPLAVAVHGRRPRRRARAGSRATWFRAGSTGSSPPAGR